MYIFVYIYNIRNEIFLIIIPILHYTIFYIIYYFILLFHFIMKNLLKCNILTLNDNKTLIYLFIDKIDNLFDIYIFIYILYYFI